MRLLRTLPLVAALLGSMTLMAQHPLAIPPLVEADTFDLTIRADTVEFYPGWETATYGINAPYLGPTLLLHKDSTVYFRWHNQINEVTTLHWNGMQVPPVYDGSPPREVLPGTTWEGSFRVIDKASMYVYHPHTMHLIGPQVAKGAAGLVIIKDEEEAQLPLPRTYGVDDFPLAVQDKRFAPSGQFIYGPYGDSILVNGTPDPYLEAPAQVVRLRLANASVARYYMFGFENDVPFHVIGSENGLLHEPVPMTRIMLSNGERAEVLLDLNGLEGDSLLLMSYGSELPATVPGTDNILWEHSSLNGADFPILRIRVGPPTVDPITTVPATLVEVNPYPEASAARTRVKEITGMGMVGGIGNFTINGEGWNENVINDTIRLGDTEIWTYVNHSNMAHPMTMHGGAFYLLDRNGEQPPAWERGPKSVVNVDVGDSVRVIMRFDEYTTDGWPLMYHCHILTHMDHMMWQFIVVDQPVGQTEHHAPQKVRIHPVPAMSTVYFQAPFPVREWMVIDPLGRVVKTRAGRGAVSGNIPIEGLAPGVHIVRFMGSQGQVATAPLIKE